MKMLLSILFGAVTLTAYALVEKRINQRACPACGFQVSADSVNEPCPRCAAIINPLPHR